MKKIQPNIGTNNNKNNLLRLSIFILVILFTVLESYYLLEIQKIDSTKKVVSERPVISYSNAEILTDANLPSQNSQPTYVNVSNPIVINSNINNSSSSPSLIISTTTISIPTFSKPEIPSACLHKYTQTKETATNIPALLYHGEAAQFGNIPLANFIDQMCGLKEDGWHTITMEQFYGFMKEGKSLPDKSFLLTFDDGRKDTYYQFDPVLKKIGFNGIMFVISGFSLPIPEKPSTFYLNQREINDMVVSGRWEMESHGDMDHKIYNIPTSTTTPQQSMQAQGHFLSNLFWSPNQNKIETEEEYKQRITNDLVYSKNIIEKDFGKHILAYAYPYNDFGQDTVNFPGSKKIIGNIVPSLYTFAFYQTLGGGNGGFLNYPNPETYLIKRIEPDFRLNAQNLIDLINSDIPKKLPYISDKFGIEWQADWGNVFAHDVLTFNAKPTTNGAEATLSGSNTWDDYTFVANINWNHGDDVSLLARNKSSGNLVECNFTRNAITIDKFVSGVRTNLASQRFISYNTSTTTQLKISVAKNNVSCYLDSVFVVSGKIDDPILQSGGIGIQVWDPKAGLANIDVKSIEVNHSNQPN